MRIIRSALLLCFCAASAHAQTITKISTATKNSTQSGASLTTAAQTHIIGNLLVVTLYHQSSGDTATGCTNLAGDTWAPVRSSALLIGGTRALEIWYTATGTAAASTPTGTIGFVNDVVTCTIDSGNTFTGADAYEFHKTSGTWGFVTQQTGTNTGTAIASASLTLTNPSVIVGSIIVETAGSLTDSNYTLTNTGGSSFIWSEYHITSSSETATATTGTSATWGILAAAFQASTAAGNSATLLIRDP